MAAWTPNTCFAVMALAATLGSAAAADPEDKPVSDTRAEESLEVTATRYPEDPANLPTVVTVLDGTALRARGITDLRSALGVVAGVDIAPGGDGGPASSVPEMWGLREFDAFLLVVDGVPWGGAFNPDLSSLSLRDVERIEVVRGSAPVMYGATSFVGVIQVVHYAPGSGHQQAALAAGTHTSGGLGAAIDLPSWLGFSSRVSMEYEKQGFPDDRADWSRGHALWRNRRDAGGGTVHFDLDLSLVNQSPASPTPRVGAELTPLVGPDDNANPLGSKVDPRRATLTGGYDHQTEFGSWSVTGSYAHASQSTLRGFLVDVAQPLSPAHGFRQDIGLDEVYLDAHATFTRLPHFSVVTGVDTLYGRGDASGGDFDYDVAPDGANPPDGRAIPSAAHVRMQDRRTFAGLYGYAAWTPQWRWRVDMGARLNVTSESRTTHAVEFESGATDGGSDTRSETRPSGTVGVAFTAWKHGSDDAKIYAGYRNTYKPAAIDFGLDSAPEILRPETGASVEIGARSSLLDRRLELELEAFQMDLEDIVIAAEGATLPGLENGGKQRLRGIELELRGRILDDLFGRVAWSLHDARFRDFEQDFGAGPVQLAGNRIEMSPRNMGSVGVIWMPKTGFTAHGEVRYTGSRYLNRRNTALAESFITWSAGIGWRAKRWSVRLDGENLGDRRDPVSESEFGDAQYYRLAPRQIWMSFTWEF
jgi:outer membrane receptor protein involved in Fe transport